MTNNKNKILTKSKSNNTNINTTYSEISKQSGGVENSKTYIVYRKDDVFQSGYGEYGLYNVLKYKQGFKNKLTSKHYDVYNTPFFSFHNKLGLKLYELKMSSSKQSISQTMNNERELKEHLSYQKFITNIFSMNKKNGTSFFLSFNKENLLSLGEIKILLNIQNIHTIKEIKTTSVTEYGRQHDNYFYIDNASSSKKTDSNSLIDFKGYNVRYATKRNQKGKGNSQQLAKGTYAAKLDFNVKADFEIKISDTPKRIIDYESLKEKYYVSTPDIISSKKNKLTMAQELGFLNTQSNRTTNELEDSYSIDDYPICPFKYLSSKGDDNKDFIQINLSSTSEINSTNNPSLKYKLKCFVRRAPNYIMSFPDRVEYRYCNLFVKESKDPHNEYLQKLIPDSDINELEKATKYTKFVTFLDNPEQTEEKGHCFKVSYGNIYDFQELEGNYFLNFLRENHELFKDILKESFSRNQQGGANGNDSSGLNLNGILTQLFDTIDTNNKDDSFLNTIKSTIIMFIINLLAVNFGSESEVELYDNCVTYLIKNIERIIRFTYSAGVASDNQSDKNFENFKKEVPNLVEKANRRKDEIKRRIHEKTTALNGDILFVKFNFQNKLLYQDKEQEVNIDDINPTENVQLINTKTGKPFVWFLENKNMGSGSEKKNRNGSNSFIYKKSNS